MKLLNIHFLILLCLIVYLYILFILINLIKTNKEFMRKIENDKQNEHVIFFYKGSPYSGIYIDYLKKIKKYCLQNLILNNYKFKTVVVDLDDTLLFTFPHKKKKEIYINNKKYGKVNILPVLKPMLELLKKIKKMGYYIYIITSRSFTSFASVKYHIEKYKIPYDAIFTSNYHGEHPIFKSKLREKMEKHIPKEIENLNTIEFLSKKPNKKHKDLIKIIMTIGDDWYDVVNGNDGIGIKLPCVNDFNCYVFNKNKIIKII